MNLLWHDYSKETPPQNMAIYLKYSSQSDEQLRVGFFKKGIYYVYAKKNGSPLQYSESYEEATLQWAHVVDYF